MFPFKISYKLYREFFHVSFVRAFLLSLLDHLEWRKTIMRWKKETKLWGKIRKDQGEINEKKKNR